MQSFSMAIQMKACTWQRFPAVLFIKHLFNDILILIIQTRATIQTIFGSIEIFEQLTTYPSFKLQFVPK